MSMDLSSMVRPVPYAGMGERIYGVVNAIVVETYDEAQQRHKLGMVRVRFPWLQAESDPNQIQPWARVASASGGPGSGFFSFPKAGDEVLVAFEHGDIHFPYVLGCLWNGRARAPEPVTPNDALDCPGHHGGPTLKTHDLLALSLTGDQKKNQVQFWRSRTGHLIAMDDENGVVRVSDATGLSTIQLEKDQLKILQRKGDIRIFAGKLARIDCETFEVHASKAVKIQAGQDFTIKVGRNMTVDLGGSFALKAAKGIDMKSSKDVHIHAGESVTVAASRDLATVASSGKMTVQAGAKIDLHAGAGLGVTTDQKLEMKGLAGARFETLGDFTMKAQGNLYAEGMNVHIN
jgi:uncharacterized protein involved in type VI secretion and phage assembly